MAKHNRAFPSNPAVARALPPPKTEHEVVMEQLLIAQNQLLSVLIQMVATLCTEGGSKMYPTEQHRILSLAAMGIGVTTQKEQVKAAADLAAMSKKMMDEA